MATRRLPIDGTNFPMISTGKCRPVIEYAEVADGSRRATGRQATDAHGTPLWMVDVILDDDDSERTETAGVKVASPDEPRLPKFQQVSFMDLTCMPYLDRRTNRVAYSFAAGGIAPTGAPATSRSKAAASTGE